MVIFNYLLMCIIFGTTFLAIKIGVDAGIPPFFSAGFRFFIAGFILFAYMCWKRKTNIKLFFRKELLLTSIGLTFGTFAALYWAEQYVTSGVAAVLSATGPILIIAIQAVLLKESTPHRSLLGCIVAIIGVAFLILPSFSLDMNLYWIIGCIIIIIGEICYAGGTIYTKRVINRLIGSPIALNAVQMMHGGILLLILSAFTEEIHIDKIVSTASVVSLLYLIIAGSMIGHSLYYWLVLRTNPVFPSTWLYISPLIAVVLGVVFYHEPISWQTVIGALTIVGGTIIANYETLLALLRVKLPIRVRSRLDTSSNSSEKI